MTTLICWAGADSRNIASLYIASDSRLTWGTPEISYDCGQKLFFSQKHLHAFGFSGDVTCASQLLHSLVFQIDNDYLKENISNKDNVEKIQQHLQKCFLNYPVQWKNEIKKSLNILHISRINNGIRVTDIDFYVNIFKFSSDDRCIVDIKNISPKSQLLHASGTGSIAFSDLNSQWSKFDPENMRTSRSFFSAFCSSLNEKRDPFSGGSPQLLGLYRQGPIQNFGIIWNNRKYLGGVEVENFDNLEWRNETFERCDPKTKAVLNNAQKQPNLLAIKKTKEQY